MSAYFIPEGGGREWENFYFLRKSLGDRERERGRGSVDGDTSQGTNKHFVPFSLFHPNNFLFLGNKKWREKVCLFPPSLPFRVNSNTKKTFPPPAPPRTTTRPTRTSSGSCRSPGGCRPCREGSRTCSWPRGSRRSSPSTTESRRWGTVVLVTTYSARYKNRISHACTNLEKCNCDYSN